MVSSRTSRKVLVALLLALWATPARAEPLPLPGNMTEAEQAVWWMHAGGSATAPLLGYWLDGRRGLWVGGAAWAATSGVQQAFFHHAHTTHREQVLDLTAKLGPTAIILLIDLVRNR